MAFNCLLEVSLVEAVKAFADLDERSASYHMNRALREYLGKNATNNDPPEVGKGE